MTLIESQSFAQLLLRYAEHYVDRSSIETLHTKHGICSISSFVSRHMHIHCADVTPVSPAIFCTTMWLSEGRSNALPANHDIVLEDCMLLLLLLLL